MPTLQEILAAKRAAAAAVPASTPSTETKIEEKVEEKKPVEQSPVSPVAAFEETKAILPEKKKSFAEMMAEKKAAAALEKKEAPRSGQDAPKNPSPIIDSPASEKVDSVLPEKKENTGETSANVESSDAEKAYYQDIKPKIDMLVSLSDDDLRGAMKTLKEALMKNPAATSLMLDTEIGEMVKALRRMTGEALVAVTTKEKKPKKEKQIDLSDPTVMQAILDDL